MVTMVTGLSGPQGGKREGVGRRGEGIMGRSVGYSVVK